MNTKRLPLVVFLLLALVQLAIPAWMVVHHEDVLQNGEIWRFRTRLDDGHDTFRGRYLRLILVEDFAPMPPGETLQRFQEVYAVLETGADGYARIGRLTATEPAAGESYVTATVRSVAESGVGLGFPFTSFYLEEDLVPDMDKALRLLDEDNLPDVWAAVRVADGYAVVEELYVGEETVGEYLRKQ
jgi:hypothetical protein